MPKKNSFIFYDDYRQHFELLKDSEVKELLFAVFDYHEKGATEKLSPVVKMAFSFIKANLKRDDNKYQNICNRNKTNGLKGGRPKEPKKPSGLSGNPRKPKKPDTDTDNDTKNTYRSFKHLSITEKEVDKICKDMRTNRETVDTFLDSVENFKNNKNYTSLNLTVRNWMKRDGYPKPSVSKGWCNSI